MYEAVRRLRIHQRILAYIMAVDALVANVPRERWYLRDQIRRAAASILLNLREGAMETAAFEKARFYRIAKRSCAEVAAALELLAAFLPHLAGEVINLDATASRITLDLHKLATEWTARGRAERQRHPVGKPTKRPLRP